VKLVAFLRQNKKVDKLAFLHQLVNFLFLLYSNYKVISPLAISSSHLVGSNSAPTSKLSGTTMIPRFCGACGKPNSRAEQIMPYESTPRNSPGQICAPFGIKVPGSATTTF